MNKIKADIRNNHLLNYYLLYGSEEVLKKQYRDRLIKALLPEADEMNLSFFADAAIDALEIISIAETLPFFAEKRVICITDSDWFRTKTPDAFVNACVEFPESTYFIFLEKEIDKRNRLFKFVTEKGYACEIKTPGDEELISMVGKTLAKKGFSVTTSDVSYFLSRVGTDMSMIQNELDKLTSFCEGKDRITSEDIDAICSEIPEGKIFKMLDAIMSGETEKAFGLYYELLAAQEKSMNILAMLNRSYNQLYQTAVLSAEGKSRDQIIRITGLRDFQYDKNARLSKRKKIEEIYKDLEYGLDLEKKVKSGNLDEKIAVEIFLAKNEII